MRVHATILFIFFALFAQAQLPGLIGMHKPYAVGPPAQSFTTVQASSYGISPTNTASQNTTSMLTMRDVLRGQNGKPEYIIVLPEGEVNYTNKHWLDGIKRYTLLGNPNGSLRIHSDRYIYNRPKSYPFAPPSPIANGIRFKSAAVGSTRLYLVNASDLSLFFVGQPLFLGGKERQFYGWPFNPAHFEYKRVKAVGTDANGAYVDIERWNAAEPDGLTFPYNENWADIMIDQFTPSYKTGKPRIYMLQRLDDTTYVFPEKAVIDGVRLAEWEGDSYRTALAVLGDSVIIRNMVHLEDSIETWATESYYTLYENNTYTGGIEVDKGNWRVELKGGTNGGGLAAGNGTRYVKMSNFTGNHWLDASPHFLELENSSWPHSTTNEFTIHTQPEGHTSVKATLKNLHFSSPNIYAGHTQLCKTHNITLAAGTVMYADPTDPNAFIINKNVTDGYNWAKAFSAPNRLRFYRSDGSQFGYVDDIIEHPDGFKVILSGVTAINGVSYKAPYYGHLIDHGGHTVAQWGVPPLGPSDMKWAGNQIDNDSSSRVTKWTQKDFKFRSGGAFPFIGIDGVIHSIKINVKTPYVGGNSRLLFAKEAFGNNSSEWIFNVDLTKTGIRLLTPSGVTGAQSGETFNAALIAGFIRSIGYQTSIASQGSTLAEFDIEVSWTPNTNQQLQQ